MPVEINPENLYVDSRVEWLSIEQVGAIVKGIESGDEFPPVIVSELQHIPGAFFVHEGIHRAAGHYIMSVPVKAYLLGPFACKRLKRVGDVGLDSDSEGYRTAKARGFYR